MLYSVHDNLAWVWIILEMLFLIQYMWGSFPGEKGPGRMVVLEKIAFNHPKMSNYSSLLFIIKTHSSY